MEHEYDGIEDEPYHGDPDDWRADPGDIDPAEFDAEPWVGLVLFGGWEDKPDALEKWESIRDEDWLDPVVAPV